MIGRVLCLLVLTPPFPGGFLAAQAVLAQERSPSIAAPSPRTSDHRAAAAGQQDLSPWPILPTLGAPLLGQSFSATEVAFALGTASRAYRTEGWSSSSPCAPFFAEACEADSREGQVAAAPGSLHIDILEGEGALNNIRQRTAREPIVQVEDKNRKPVAGALVLFAVHPGTTGAGAAFGNAATVSAVTDADGRAVATGLRPNQQVGPFTIEVTATLGALIATATIHETNTRSNAKSQNQQNSPAIGLPTSGTHISVRSVLLIEGAAVGLGFMTALLLNRTSTTTITAGTGTVGAP